MSSHWEFSGEWLRVVTPLRRVVALLLWAALLPFPPELTAQAGTDTSSSALTIFTYERFLEQVLQQHPLALQADLQPEMGQAAVRKARGKFDPEALLNLASKYDNGSLYYRQSKGGLKIPTWFGAELLAAYEQNEGQYLNPENTVTGRGLYYAGVSVPLGRGLFLDERRAALRQAQLYEEGTAAERQLLLNDLLYSAGTAYWSWFKAYHALSVYDTAVALARQRLDAVRQAAELGDRPSIDTLEAAIQVQSRQISRRQAALEYDNATAWLSVYLWDSGELPLELDTNTVPHGMDQISALAADPQLLALLDQLPVNHPALQLAQIKLSQLYLNRRLMLEQFKPTINLEYFALNTPTGPELLQDYAVDNYKFGLNVSVPLFMRQARGEVALANLKIDEANFQLSGKTAELGAKARMQLNTVDATLSLAEIYSRTVRDLGSLLAGERALFNGGESSLFLINAREMAFISARVEQISLLVENRKAVLGAQFAFGVLGSDALSAP
jgi:outer membrane protein TolC